MATLNQLKRTLRQTATATASCRTQPLSDSQYDAGFKILRSGPGRTPYQDFIIPQLSLLLAQCFDSRSNISALEIGPGPESVFGCLPDALRRKIKRYAAFEPNDLFAAKLQEVLWPTSDKRPLLPCLENPPNIHRGPFVLDRSTENDPGKAKSVGKVQFDIVLFCHSMYGMRPKTNFIEQALRMICREPEGGIVVVFHRDGGLHLDGLVCHRTASFPTGITRVADDDEALDRFAPFIAGFVMQDVSADNSVKSKWRKICRVLGHRDKDYPGYLLFSSPNVMAAFTQHATTLPELMERVQFVSQGKRRVKNREARVQHPASIARPTGIEQIQHCVRWALKHTIGLTVFSGGHSGHCLQHNVVSIDMSAFDNVHIVSPREEGEEEEAEKEKSKGFDIGRRIVVEGGCKSGEVIRKTMAAGLTIPLGARPSVGTGLWLQGGIGHLTRLYGLACDSIVGAVVVSVASGEVLIAGRVPRQHQPAGAVHAENGTDLLWAIKGAGTNFGIVVSATFRAYVAPTYSIRNWIKPLSDNIDGRIRLSNLDESIARKVPRNCSVDAYLYCDAGTLRLGVTIYECSMGPLACGAKTSTYTPVSTMLGAEDSQQVVDGVGLFETEMYMSGMHGGHGAGKTSSFKRCIFLKRLEQDVCGILMAALEARPSQFCYFHLLHGGGAAGEVADDATAFGCRDWDYACVITGVWPRDQDGNEAARGVVKWVYGVVRELLPLCSGVYGADLGPDPRDAELAAKAFGPNLARLVRLKSTFDPSNVLAYACPLPKVKTPLEQKLIIVVTGESCSGKDYCAEIWAAELATRQHTRINSRAVSISDAIKQEYAAATGANLERLLHDRAYKELHRPALSTYWQDKLRQRPRLPEDSFLNVVHDAGDADVLLITGLRDEAPVAALSHLVPNRRLLEVRVRASRDIRAVRGSSQVDDDDNDDDENGKNSKDRPSLIFHNDATGNDTAKLFCRHYLLPLLGEDLQRLANMVHSIPNFPRPGIDFRDVLGIPQQPGGLALCTSLLQTHFTGDWANVSRLVCCETGSFVFASALAARVDVPLALIRDAGKLPPPTVSVPKTSSHISSSACENPTENIIEMGKDVIPRGTSVVVLDDTLATGETLCAVLSLLDKAGINARDVDVLVVAELPAHRGRQLLREHGFGGAKIQSLLIFDGK